MAFWHFGDARYKGARALLIASIIGVLLSALGLTLLLWNRGETPAEAVGAASSPEPTPTPPPTPEQLRLAAIEKVRIELQEKVDLKDLAQIEAVSRKLLEMEPGDIEGWRHLGWSLEQQGNLPAARDAYAKAISLPGSGPYILFLRARVLRKSGDLRAAIVDLEEATRRDPASVGMSNLLMIYKIQDGRIEEVRTAVQNYASVGIKAQADLWLLGAAGVALHDGDMPQAAVILEGFQAATDPPLFSELLADPFFDPYRNHPDLIKFFPLANP